MYVHQEEGGGFLASAAICRRLGHERGPRTADVRGPPRIEKPFSKGAHTLEKRLEAFVTGAHTEKGLARPKW